MWGWCLVPRFLKMSSRDTVYTKKLNTGKQLFILRTTGSTSWQTFGLCQLEFPLTPGQHGSGNSIANTTPHRQLGCSHFALGESQQAEVHAHKLNLVPENVPWFISAAPVDTARKAVPPPTQANSDSPQLQRMSAFGFPAVPAHGRNWKTTSSWSENMDSTNAAMKEQEVTGGRAKAAGHWKWLTSRSANQQY